jgi:DNA-directed RNA polymerase subunit F
MTDESTITISEIAERVGKTHDLLSTIRQDSIDTVDWIEHRIEEAEGDGDDELVEELSALMGYVHTLYVRIGDVAYHDEEPGVSDAE